MADWRSLGKIIPLMQATLLEAFKSRYPEKTWRVVVDPGCGAAFQVAPAMLKAHWLQSHRAKRSTRRVFPC